MNDTELDAELRTHARRWQDEFSPPPLAGMLEVAVTSKRSRLRWAGPLIAAVLLLAIPLITVVSLHHHARSTPAIAPVPKGIPIGTLTWKDPVLQDDGTITLPAEPVPNSDFCKYHYNVGAVIDQSTTSSITITATQYQDGPAQLDTFNKGLCADPSVKVNGGLTATIRLDQRLGHRVLVDAKDGSTHKVLDAATVPKAGYLPPGYAGSVVGWDGTDSDSAVRTYKSAKAEYWIERRPIPNDYDGSPMSFPAAGTGTVHGQPAKYITLGGPYVAWQENGYVWTVTSAPYEGALVGDVSEVDLFKIANSIH